MRSESTERGGSQYLERVMSNKHDFHCFSFATKPKEEVDMNKKV